VVTAFSPDCIIRVWESSSGRLVKKLEVRCGHSCCSSPERLSLGEWDELVKHASLATTDDVIV